MNEVYNREDFLKAFEKSMRESMFRNAFLNNLAYTKMERLNTEHNKLWRKYDEDYRPIILENQDKEKEDYTISNTMVKTINKHQKKCENSNKQLKFYRKFTNDFNSDNTKKRIIRVIKDLKKYLKVG